MAQLIEDFGIYELPETQPDLPEAMQASLRFLTLARPEIVTPLWALAYLAPLADLIAPTFLVWLHGPSRTYKAPLSALLLSHFGRFRYNTPPATWTDSALSLETKAIEAEHCVLWVDDYSRHYEGDAYFQSKVTHMVKSWCAGVGGSDAPRVYALCTSDVYSINTVILPHLFDVPVQHKDITMRVRAAVNQAVVEDAPLYSQAMAGYVNWIHAQEPSMLDNLRWWVVDLADEAGAVMALPELHHLGALGVGFSLGLAFAESLGLLSHAEFQQQQIAGWKALLAAGERQYRVQSETLGGANDGRG